MRPLAARDIDDALVAQLRNPEISNYLALGVDPARVTRDALLQMLKIIDNRRSFFFGIAAIGNPRRLGFCFARTDNAGVATLTAAVTDPSLWRRGLAAAAVYALRVFMFDLVKVHKVVARAYADNAATLAGLERYGWVREGVLREAEPDGKGGRRDVVVFGLLRSEHERGPKPKAYTPASS